MLSKDKRQNITGSTVGELIHILSSRPKDAIVSCCGDASIYIHETEDGRTISFDYSDLDDYYNEIAGEDE